MAKTQYKAKPIGAKPDFTLHLPSYVKRVRKVLDNNPEILKRGACEYKCKNGSTCIIGAGLTKKQLNIVGTHQWNTENVQQLIENNVMRVDKRYAKRLRNLQLSFDQGTKEQTRLRFRHLEESVKKNFPASFKN